MQASMEERDQYWQQILQEKESHHTELLQTKARGLYYGILSMEWLRQSYKVKNYIRLFYWFIDSSVFDLVNPNCSTGSVMCAHVILCITNILTDWCVKFVWILNLNCWSLWIWTVLPTQWCLFVKLYKLLLTGGGACSVTETDGGGHGPEAVRTGTGNEASHGGEGPTENGYPLPAGLT